MPGPGGNDAQPLTGIRVLDLSGESGVYCGKLLADVGADVIKVEPLGGDPMRRIGPFLEGAAPPENSLDWRHYNTNKRGITLDIASDAGGVMLRRLAARSDVLVESFQPGYLESLDLGYGQLSETNPGLVYASLTPYGQTGPYRDYRASDLTGFAMGGYLYPTGWSHTPPNKLWGLQAYQTTSNRAFIGILIALYHRLATGLGQYVDVSMQESVAATTEHVNTTYNYTGESAVRCGFRHGGQFVATWPCRDGYVSITTNTQKAWDDLRAWMARDGMAGDLMDEQYDDRFILRGDLSSHIEGLVEAWTKTHTRKEITDRGQANHHPWGPVSTASELLDNEQLWDRGFYLEVEDGGGKLVYPGAPYKLSGDGWRFGAPAPSVGQHNRQVYCEELGLSDEEYQHLKDTGVV
ncbi:MAG: CaiB/BaiF CoA-transferase family protein [Chloroflexi bacterium]|nr:CaiB/BaiF CoA-transferase family protein [Chloroflexota bacterium]MDA1270649.1 CaiB/BaiF CoA-transferase family protein [Chloroflexota bacterium]